MNAIDPNLMTTEERLAEVASILATGIRRLREKQKTEKFPLDKLADQWPYGQNKTTKRKRP